jgi:DNA-binding NarL/FixJ family response regulator
MIRLLIVDDQSLICEGLKAMLSLEEDLEVVGVAHNGEQALAQVDALLPDVVLIDVRMPVMDGREATRKICQHYPSVKVLVLSTFDDTQYIADAIRAGAKGYLLKDMPSEELALAVRSVHRGYTQLAPGLLEKVAQTFSDTPVSAKDSATQVPNLTPREQEVLQLVALGYPNREIASALFISEGTVKTHVTHLLDRLNLRNRSQLAIYANTVLQLNSN